MVSWDAYDLQFEFSLSLRRKVYNDYKFGNNDDIIA